MSGFTTAHGFELAASYPAASARGAGDAAGHAGFELAAAAAWDAPRAALFGASGSGKSTVLEALAGLRPEVAGPVQLGGRRLEGLAPERRRLGWVPQDSALFPHLTVLAQLRFAARVSGGSKRDLDQAVEALELGALLERRPAALSGGERSRVAIARALCARPAMLLLDEPLAALDRPLRARVLPYLDRVGRELGVPTLLVSHDPLEVAALADHVAVLERGRVVASGPVSAVLPGAASFGALEALSAENRFAVRVVETHGGSRTVETAGGTRLEMAAVPGFPEPRGVAVRAEDLLISLAPLEGVSAQNQLRAICGEARPLSGAAGQPGGSSGGPPPGAAGVHPTDTPGDGPLGLELFLGGAGRGGAGGERWIAAITPRAKSRLGLKQGLSVHLAIKATAVLADPNPPPAR